MGIKMAPAYANLFMGKLEMKLTELGHKHMITWKTFIDDIFIIWTGTRDEFTTYIDTANTLHSTIKLTYKVSEHELTFLDTTVIARAIASATRPYEYQ